MAAVTASLQKVTRTPLTQKPFGRPGGRGWTAALATCGVTVAVCVVAVSSASDPLKVPGGVPLGAARVSIAALGGIAAASALISLAALLWALVPRLGRRGGEDEEALVDQTPLLPLRYVFTGLALVALLLAATVLALVESRRRHGSQLGSGSLALRGGRALGAGASGSLPLVPFAIAGLAVLALLGAAAVLIYARERRGMGQRGPRRPSPPPAEVLLAGVERSIDELRAAADPRAAVIAAYARMERLLAAAGLARARPEAPREYLQRAAPLLGDAGRRLTALFEEARFSPHPIGEDARGKALAALEQLRSRLART